MTWNSALRADHHYAFLQAFLPVSDRPSFLLKCQAACAFQPWSAIHRIDNERLHEHQGRCRLTLLSSAAESVLDLRGVRLEDRDKGAFGAVLGRDAGVLDLTMLCEEPESRALRPPMLRVEEESSPNGLSFAMILSFGSVLGPVAVRQYTGSLDVCCLVLALDAGLFGWTFSSTEAMA